MILAASKFTVGSEIVSRGGRSRITLGTQQHIARSSDMLRTVEVGAVLTVAVAMALSLAHALELPGKMRLSKEQYLATQRIYYPGFTFGGMAEPVGLILLIVLLVLMPEGLSFWLVMGSMLALLAMHASYWLMTHPVNNFWLGDSELAGAGKAFFASDPFKRGGKLHAPDWTELRDRWEFSHALRAVFGLTSLALLVTAVSIQS